VGDVSDNGLDFLVLTFVLVLVDYFLGKLNDVLTDEKSWLLLSTAFNKPLQILNRMVAFNSNWKQEIIVFK